jgi:hypothetical protein
MKLEYIWMFALAFALVAEAGAEQYAYPAKGQTPQQQKDDEAACHVWAVQKTGFDPAKATPPQAAVKPPTTAAGTTPGAGAPGAARGAVAGEVVDGEAGAGAGAAAGAMVVRSADRKLNAATAQQRQQLAEAAAQRPVESFAKARGACLEIRGYTVK